MGMYTEIYVNVDLKPETPPEIIETIRAMCEHKKESPLLIGKPTRWCYLFNNGSYYTPYTSCSHLTYDMGTSRYSLIAKGDLKNYEEEIEKFFTWLIPHIDGESGDFIGYKRYEENKEPTLIYLP